MEILKREPHHTIWIGRDAEGRTVYGVTLNAEDGTPVEPNSLPFYSMTSAILNLMAGGE